MKRVGSTQNGSEPLKGYAHNVIVRLLSGERNSGGLRMSSQHPGLGVLGAVFFPHQAGPDAAGRAELGDLFEEIVVHVKEKRKPRGKVINLHTALEAFVDVTEPIRKRKSQLLDSRRPSLADMVSAHADGVPVRIMFCSVLDRIDDELHGGFDREEPFLLRDVFFENIVLKGAADFFFRNALLFGDGQVHGQNDDGRSIDRHRSRDFAKRDAGVEDLHVLERGDGDAALADFAFAFGAVGVVSHERGHIESRGKSSLAVLKQKLKSLIGFHRARETRELAHRPELAAIHIALNAAGVRILAGKAEIAEIIETSRFRDPAGVESSGTSISLRVVKLPSRSGNFFLLSSRRASHSAGFPNRFVFCLSFWDMSLAPVMSSANSWAAITMRWISDVPS